jgi:hypothetical protein
MSYAKSKPKLYEVQVQAALQALTSPGEILFAAFVTSEATTNPYAAVNHPTQEHADTKPTILNRPIVTVLDQALPKQPPSATDLPNVSFAKDPTSSTSALKQPINRKKNYTAYI